MDGFAGGYLGANNLMELRADRQARKVTPTPAAPPAPATSGRSVMQAVGAPPPKDAAFDPSQFDEAFVSGIRDTASALQIEPEELATFLSYETAGTFDPLKKGPTTQHGQHQGLIQFGEPQAAQFGADFTDKASALRSQLGKDGAIVKYALAHGYKPGEHNGLDLYSTINAGAPGRYKASDANNGGAPGSVQDKYDTQMSGHRAKARALLDFYPVQEVNPAPTARSVVTAIDPVDQMFSRFYKKG